MEHATLPFAVLAALSDHEDRLDRFRQGHRVGDANDARHRKSGSDPFPGKVRNGCLVVREQEPALLRCPSQHRRVIGTSQTNLLDAHNVEVGLPEEKPSNDRPVEVLIRKEGEHLAQLWDFPRANNRFRMPLVGNRASN
jgi:hypothetical protein